MQEVADALNAKWKADRRRRARPLHPRVLQLRRGREVRGERARHPREDGRAARRLLHLRAHHGARPERRPHAGAHQGRQVRRSTACRWRRPRRRSRTAGRSCSSAPRRRSPRSRSRWPRSRRARRSSGWRLAARGSRLAAKTRAKGGLAGPPLLRTAVRVASLSSSRASHLVAASAGTACLLRRPHPPNGRRRPLGAPAAGWRHARAAPRRAGPTAGRRQPPAVTAAAR